MFYHVCEIYMHIIYFGTTDVGKTTCWVNLQSSFSFPTGLFLWLSGLVILITDNNRQFTDKYYLQTVMLNYAGEYGEYCDARQAA